METVSYQGQMHTVWRTRPCNCNPQVGVNERCLHCRQYHLRPGYCQALDPINAAQYPDVHKPEPVNTEPVHKASVNTSVNTKPVHETEIVDTDERRKAYRREWMQQWRAKQQRSE